MKVDRAAEPTDFEVSSKAADGPSPMRGLKITRAKERPPERFTFRFTNQGSVLTGDEPLQFTSVYGSILKNCKALMGELTSTHVTQRLTGTTATCHCFIQKASCTFKHAAQAQIAQH